MTQKETSPVKFSCIYIAKFTKNNYMNQILNPKYNKVKLNTHNNPKSSISVSSKQIRFITLLVLSVFLLIFILVYMAYNFYVDYKKSNLYLIGSYGYSISRLYSDNTFAQQNSEAEKLFSIIGIIKIDKIKISYPIISDLNDELLKIAPCKFSGPNANEIRKPMHCCT